MLTFVYQQKMEGEFNAELWAEKVKKSAPNAHGHQHNYFEIDPEQAKN